MRLGFEEAQTPYESPSQSARVWTETWVRREVYCPNCGQANLEKFANNRPLADFSCLSCSEEYELKSQKNKFGSRVVENEVISKWKKTLFLRDQGLEARGWLIEVMKCVESIGRKEFDLSDVYAFESELRVLYPNNRHIRDKIRQQLQVLRNQGYLDFTSRGHYRLRSVY